MRKQSLISFVSNYHTRHNYSVSQSIDQSFFAQFTQLLSLIIITVSLPSLHGYINPLVLIRSRRLPVVNIMQQQA